MPAYIRPLFCVGKGPFRWCALSGDPEDIHRTDRRLRELFPEEAALGRWLEMATERISFQGLPARICWLGLGQRHLAGLAFNEMVRKGELGAPVVIGRDHLDAGSVASPNRETEAMRDGSDAVSDWPFLNALLNCASGATWVSIHHGGGVGMGFSQHAGMVICCDGSLEADRRIARVLWNDPATGVMRHADAGYEDAIECARRSTACGCRAFSGGREDAAPGARVVWSDRSPGRRQSWRPRSAIPKSSTGGRSGGGGGTKSEEWRREPWDVYGHPDRRAQAIGPSRVADRPGWRGCDTSGGAGEAVIAPPCGCPLRPEGPPGPRAQMLKLRFPSRRVSFTFSP